MLLRGSACTLVPWRADHALALVGIANDVEVSRYLLPSFPSPYALEDATAWIDLQLRAEVPSHVAIEVGGELAGGIGVTFGHAERYGSAFVGYFIGRAFWGRGIATDALRTIVTYAMDFPEVYRIWANVMGPNVASRRVLEKAGFRHEATLASALVDRYGVRQDEYIFTAMVARTLIVGPA